MSLDRHGTQLVALKPSNIVQAAESDLKRKARKREGAEGQRDPYAFHRVHVRKAADPRELIALAEADAARGRQSGKRNTRLIYAARNLLRLALDHLRGDWSPGDNVTEGGMTEPTIAERIKSQVAKQLDVPLAKVTDGAGWFADLDGDELDRIELVMTLEEEFGIEIGDDAIESIATVADIVACVEREAARV